MSQDQNAQHKPIHLVDEKRQTGKLKLNLVPIKLSQRIYISKVRRQIYFLTSEDQQRNAEDKYQERNTAKEYS